MLNANVWCTSTPYGATYGVAVYGAHISTGTALVTCAPYLWSDVAFARNVSCALVSWSPAANCQISAYGRSCCFVSLDGMVADTPIILADLLSGRNGSGGSPSASEQLLSFDHVYYGKAGALEDRRRWVSALAWWMS